MYASVVYLIAKYYEMFAFSPPFFLSKKWVHIILNFVKSCYIDCSAFSVNFSTCQFGFHVLEYYLVVNNSTFEHLSPPFFLSKKWVHIILNFVKSCFNPIYYEV
jgi:hypothetical protein